MDHNKIRVIEAILIAVVTTAATALATHYISVPIMKVKVDELAATVAEQTRQVNRNNEALIRMQGEQQVTNEKLTNLQRDTSRRLDLLEVRAFNFPARPPQQ